MEKQERELSRSSRGLHPASPSLLCSISLWGFSFPHNWGLLYGALASNLLGPCHTQNQVFMALFLRRNGCNISEDSHFQPGGDRALDLCPLLLHFCPALGVSQTLIPTSFCHLFSSRVSFFCRSETLQEQNNPSCAARFPTNKESRSSLIN